MNILIIPEDFRKDQYILRPVVKAILSYLKKPNANVRVCQDPLLGGISQALQWRNIAQIIEMYDGMVDIFLLLVDRDGQPGRRTALDAIELQAASALPPKRLFVAEHAWQELEVWALAGCDDLPGDWNWSDIRNERDPKERYFDPYAQRRNLLNEPGEGRKTLGDEAGKNYQRVRRLCSEEFEPLEQKISRFLAAV